MGMKVSNRRGQSWGKNARNMGRTMEEDLVWPNKMCASDVGSQGIWSEKTHMGTSHPPLSRNIKEKVFTLSAKETTPFKEVIRD